MKGEFKLTHVLGLCIVGVIVVGMLTFFKMIKELRLSYKGYVDVLVPRSAEEYRYYEYGEPRYSFKNLPIIFEQNLGQADRNIKYLSQGNDYSLYLKSNEAILILKRRVEVNHTKLLNWNSNLASNVHETESVLHMKLVGAEPNPEINGLEEIPNRNLFSKATNAGSQNTNVPLYKKIEYKSVYPGIDLVYYGRRRQLEYDFVVAPGANPKMITLKFSGVEKIYIDERGDLVLHTKTGTLRQRAPLIYQTINGTKQRVHGRFIFKPNQEIGFQVATYDVTKPLVIDPIIERVTSKRINLERKH